MNEKEKWLWKISIMEQAIKCFENKDYDKVTSLCNSITNSKIQINNIPLSSFTFNWN